MIHGILIKKEARASLVSEIQKFSHLETGGVLCGFYQDDYLVIESVSGPGPNAVHQIDEFVIDKQYMDSFLEDQYAGSGGLHIYLGEWHTHPQIHPQPSEQDLISICERTLEWQHGSIAFLIIGFLGFTPEKIEEQSICVFYHQEKKSFYKLPIKFEES